MYRRNYLHGCCVMAFAFGLMVGHCLESWLLCCCGGLGLLVLGLSLLRKK